ncbi:MAG: hypothetical protein RLZZ135_548 [Cyanobacteriota bacterium]|jgi:hypothetical protein
MSQLRIGVSEFLFGMSNKNDDKGGKKIIAQRAAINKALKVAIAEIEKQTGISLN